MLGRPEAALREFRTAVELMPMDADAHYNMGLALNTLGRHAEAVTAYRKAVRIRPDYADAWGNLGLTANLIGQYRESIEAFERAQALRPEYFDSRRRQREAFEASRRGGALAPGGRLATIDTTGGHHGRGPADGGTTMKLGGLAMAAGLVLLVAGTTTWWLPRR